MNTNRRLLLRTLSTAPVALCGSYLAGSAFAAPIPSKTVAISGAVASPMSYAVKDLEQFPVQTVDFKANDGNVRKYTGVLLRDVLMASKPIESEHNTLRQSYALAKATDGYFALFTWAELFISPIGDGALIVYLRDGKPLGDDEGAIALISARDTRPGPRHVKWLSSVDFRRAAP